MSRRLVSTVLISLLSLILLPIERASGQQPRPYRLQPLVVEGDPAPPVTFGSFDTAAINDRGDLVFAAGGPLLSSGLFFRSTAGALVPIALTGQQAPGTDGGRFDVFFSRLLPPSINNRGAVAFKACIVGGRYGPNGGDGIFLFSDDHLTPVALAGDIDPGTNGRFIGFSPPQLNDEGAIVFGAIVQLDQEVELDGIFLYSDGVIRSLLLSGEEAPGTGGGVFSLFYTGVFLAMNNPGDIAFAAAVEGGNVDDGIFFLTDNRLAPLVLSGQEAPGTGGDTFQSFRGSFGSLNDTGELAFTVSLADDFLTQSYLFVYSGGITKPVALWGQPAPTGDGGTFSSLLSPSINNDGNIAFYARLSGTITDEGVFAYRNGRLESVAVVAQEIADSERFSTFDLMASFGYPPAVAVSLNDSGDIAFLASLSGQRMRLGIFLASNGNFRLLVTSADASPESAFSAFKGSLFSMPLITSRDEVGFAAVAAGNGWGLYLRSAETITPVAVTGQEAPGTGGAVFFNLCSIFSSFAINERKVVVFNVSLAADPDDFICSIPGTEKDGIFLCSGGIVTPVALAGEEVPETGGLRFGRLPSFRNNFGAVAINDSNTVVFPGFITDGTVPGSKWGIFLYSNDRIDVVVLSGQQAPGTGGGSFFTLGLREFGAPFFFPPAINNAGSIAFYAQVLNDRPFTDGLFLYSDRQIHPIVLRGEEAPGTNGARFSASIFGLSAAATFGPPQINDRGEIVFVASYAQEGATYEDWQQSIFRYADGRISPIVLMGQEAPGTGGGVFGTEPLPFFQEIFPVFDHLSFNERGAVAFVSKVRGGTAQRGLFVATVEGIVPIAFVGDEVSSSRGGRFSEFTSVSLSSSGAVAFTANVTGGLFSSGVFLATPTR